MSIDIISKIQTGTPPDTNAFSAWDEQLDACMGDNYGEFVRLRGGEAAIQTALQADPRFMLITYVLYDGYHRDCV